MKNFGDKLYTLDLDDFVAINGMDPQQAVAQALEEEWLVEFVPDYEAAQRVRTGWMGGVAPTKVIVDAALEATDET